MIRYTRKEELWPTRSHAAGILLGVVVGILFLVICYRGDNSWARAGVILYLFGMLGSYAASTAYHATPRRSKWKERLRKWDHAAIYWHIAGSYSPITLIALREYGCWGWALFAFIWAAAIVGTVKSFMDLKDNSLTETVCFVAMGMSVLVAFGPLSHCVGAAAMWWIVAEGVSYVTGAVFYSVNRRRCMHTVFHFFVLLGSVCHIVAVWEILLRYL